MKEIPLNSLPGIPTLLGLIAADLVAAWLIIQGAQTDSAPSFIVAIVLFVLSGFGLIGLYMVEPNQAAVLSLFGKYVGTVKENGLRWNNPFYSKKKVSQRVRNFESGKLKVNELDGSPIEIAAVIVWQVVDAFEAGAFVRRERLECVERLVDAVLAHQVRHQRHQAFGQLRGEIAAVALAAQHARRARKHARVMVAARAQQP